MGTLYETFKLRAKAYHMWRSYQQKFYPLLSIMIKSPGPFERPQIVGVLTFCYGNMYLVA